MKLRTLELIKFGCFTDRRLDFSTPGAALHVIYGNNEAGKSTALRALTGLFYGIPARTPDAFRHEPRDLRVGAELERADGVRRAFVRRKGNRDTLLTPDGVPVPEVSLVDFLGGTTSEIFNTMYLMDHASLVAGGEELLEGEGELAKSLYQAGTGITRLREVLSGLEQEADQLFKPTLSKSLVLRALDDFMEAQKRIRNLSVSPKGWSERLKNFEAKAAELEKLKRKLGNIHERVARLTRFQLAMPHVSRRKELQAGIQALDAIALPHNAASEREAAERSRQTANERKTQAESRLSQLNSQLEQLSAQDELLANAGEIASVGERVDSFRKAQRDLPGVQAEQRQLEADAVDILRQIRPELSVTDAHSLQLTVPQRVRIRALAEEYPVLHERFRSALERVQATELDLQQARSMIEQLASVPDSTALKATVEHIRAEGDLVAAERQAASALKSAQHQAESELARLPLWTRTLDELVRSPVPSSATLDSFESRFSDIDREYALLNKQIEQAGQSHAQIESQIHALHIGGAVPTEPELDAARKKRNETWKLVLTAWREGASIATTSAIDTDTPLTEAFEATVSEADLLADRLRREADRVAKLASLLADKETCIQTSSALTLSKAQCDARLAQCQADWQEQWKATGIVALTPKEMRAWLVSYLRIVELAAKVRTASQTLTELQERIIGHLRDLRVAFNNVKELQAGETTSLTMMLEAADSALEQISNAASARANAENGQRTFVRENAKAILDRDEESTALSKWKSDWAIAIAPLALAEDTHATEAAAVLDSLDDMFGKLAESSKRQSRVDDMQEHIATFTRDVLALITKVAVDLRDLPAETAASRLQQYLSKAQQDLVRRQSAESQVENEKVALSSAVLEIERSEAELRRLLGQAKCTDVAALREAEAKSERDRTLRGLLDQTNEMLSGFTGGVGLEEFLVEVDGMNVDQLQVELDELTRERTVLEEQRSGLEQHLGSERAALAANDGSVEAAAAAEDAQAALAMTRQHAERHIRLRLATEVLRQHIERYRQQHQDPVIRRASEIFRRLTVGFFLELRTGFDDKDRPILVGVRPSGEEVQVAGMSDGTRDQLFLALRLASLERQMRTGETVPLVLDDILVNFDDRRAQATLEQLVEAAAITQVLFFTHHSRLLDLAKAVVPTELLAIHNLS